MNNKELIKKLYEEYKKEYLNEIYDIPLEYKKESPTKYLVYKDNKEIAYFLFTFKYDINNSPVDYKRYKLDRYWSVDWYWSQGISKEEKNAKNFIRVTSTAFKIVDDFIRNHNYPSLLGFGGLTEQHENIYSDEKFVDRWNILLGERYYIKWDIENDKMWIINKNFYKTDEAKIYDASRAFEKSLSEIYRQQKFPTKRDTKGISRHNLIKEQIRRIILKQIYLK